MIKSMTGFGSAKGVSGKLEITVEVKSVNNRHLDCCIKLPRVYCAIEETLKSVAGGYISRGKVDISVYIDSSNADDIEIKANHSLASAYIKALREIAKENNIPGDINITDLTKYPDILQASKREVDVQAIGSDISGILRQALDEFNAMRTREGEKLKADILSRIDVINTLTASIEEISPETVAEYRKKLEIRMSEVLENTCIDEARILAEAAIFADRTAVNEEIVRLRSHTSELSKLINANEPVGRRVDFLVQEMNREANTIGSKGNNARMTMLVVDLKAEIEKIREQAQNVE